MENVKKPNTKLIVIIACIAAAAVIAVVAVALGVHNTPAKRFLRAVDAGQKFLASMNYTEAIVQFDLAISIDPKDPAPYLGKADALFAQGKDDEAIEVLRKGFEETQDEEIQKRIEEWERQQAALAEQSVADEQSDTDEKIPEDTPSGKTIEQGDSSELRELILAIQLMIENEDYRGLINLFEGTDNRTLAASIIGKDGDAYHYVGDTNERGEPNGWGTALFNSLGGEYSDINDFFECLGYSGEWKNGVRSGNGTNVRIDFNLVDSDEPFIANTVLFYKGGWDSDMPEGEGIEHGYDEYVRDGLSFSVTEEYTYGNCVAGLWDGPLKYIVTYLPEERTCECTASAHSGVYDVIEELEDGSLCVMMCEKTSNGGDTPYPFLSATEEWNKDHGPRVLNGSSPRKIIVY